MMELHTILLYQLYDILLEYECTNYASKQAKEERYI